ncbi:MAG: hypothetical protein Q4F77_06395 [Acinetobacter sp.]|uniref:hypothetical protein n=1 Tax=Acinetobacter sp. TaxID=472 RepID=UPI0026E009AD|nr:hypothetical protein [Acinetobacter sp.]MDO5542923.1 hypothetical protein [Acinetobacter sp.]
MLTQPYKQMWFVVLMAFVMGWSGIVSAAVKPAPDWMMSNHAVGSEIRYSATAAHGVTSLPDCHMTALQTHPETKQHISEHGANANQHLSQHTSATDTDLNAADCYGSADFSTAKTNCQDCAQLHCQSLNSVLNVQVPELIQPIALTSVNIVLPVYQAQHLLGHWQQILRPPKA